MAVANYSGTPRSGTAPLEVSFTDSSTGEITSWSWTFGDGGTGAQQHPTYTYDDPGTYTVTLEVSGPGGTDSETKTDYITVTEAGTQYTLTVNVQGQGSVTLDPYHPDGSYDAGTKVTLTPVEGSGLVFTGWSGNLSGLDNPAIITMDSDKIVTATFVTVEVDGGQMTRCNAVDPADIGDPTDRPQDLPYGLIEMEIDAVGGTATVTIRLPSRAPDGYTWYKYGYKYDEVNQQYEQDQTWYDYSDHIVFNDDRDQVTLTLVDGGIGDDDRDANGEIVDPSGLGIAASTPSPPSPGNGSSGGGGCFIDTAVHNSSTAHIMSICK